MVKRLQNGDMAPVGEDTVLKGQRSIKLMVSSMVRFAPGRFELRRDVMFGVKIAAQIAWAEWPMVDSGPSSKLVQSSWSRVLFLPVPSSIMTML